MRVTLLCQTLASVSICAPIRTPPLEALALEVMGASAIGSPRFLLGHRGCDAARRLEVR
jgi:hypothetical protein